MKRKKVSLTGISSNCSHGGTITIATVIEAIDLVNYFSVFDIPTELEPTFQAIHSKTNKGRLDTAVSIIERGLEGNVVAPLPILTFAICGDTHQESIGKQVISIEYEPRNTLIVDGVVFLFALMNLLGFEHPFVQKRASQKLISRSPKKRQEVAKLSLVVNLVVVPQTAKKPKDLIDLYNFYNKLETNLHTPLLSTMHSEELVIQYVRDLAQDIELGKHGGMTSKYARLSKNDRYLVTEVTMIRLVIGAIGGSEAQDKNKTSDFGKASHPFSYEQVNEAYPLLVAFLRAWLTELMQKKPDQDGFHRSPQLWQALGLVIFSIKSHKSEVSYLEQCGTILGKLDYSRDADHWKDCSVMEKDINNKYYKNAAGGGRAFRVGLAKYLKSLLC